MLTRRAPRHIAPIPGALSGSRASSFVGEARAQSLIEVAVMMPLFILLFCIAVDYGYFFIVAASLTSSARNAVEYSVQGVTSAGKSPLPAAGDISSPTSVAALAVADISAFLNASTTTSVYVCSGSILPVNSDHTSKCASFGASALSYTADIDPEQAMFQLNRVDVVYTVTPPIPLNFLPTGMAPASMTFHRMAEMRSIN